MRHQKFMSNNFRNSHSRFQSSRRDQHASSISTKRLPRLRTRLKRIWPNVNSESQIQFLTRSSSRLIKSTMMRQRFKLTASRIQSINSLRAAQSREMITRASLTKSMIFRARKMAQSLPFQSLKEAPRLQVATIQKMTESPAMMQPTKRLLTGSRVITRREWSRRGNRHQQEALTPTGRALSRLRAMPSREASAQVTRRLLPHMRSHHKQKQARIKS